MYLAQIFTIAANLAGICAISVPCGDTETDGKKLPVGLQVMAPAFEEARLLRIARAYETTCTP
jgi:aspartyl-tRNA(Asn)/glutamyl-tRNA(Gln) amidotransferase subunit A